MTSCLAVFILLVFVFSDLHSHFPGLPHTPFGGDLIFYTTDFDSPHSFYLIDLLVLTAPLDLGKEILSPWNLGPKYSMISMWVELRGSRDLV